MDNIRAIVEYEYAAKEPDELDLHKGAIIHRIKQMPGGWWQGTLKANGQTGMFPDNFVRVLDSNSSNSNGNGNHSGDDSAAVQLRDKSATSNRRCKVIYSYTQVNDDELTLAVGDVIEFLGEVEEGWWRGRLRSKVGVFPSNFVQHIEPSPILASKRPPTIGATVTTSALTAKAASIATGVAAAPQAAAAPPAAAPPPAAAATKSSRKPPQASLQHSKNKTTANNIVAAADPSGIPMLPPKPQREFCRVQFPYAPQNEDELELKVDDIITIVTMELPDKGWWKGEIRGKVGVFPDNFVKLLAPTEAPPPVPPPRPRARARATAPRPQRGGSFEFLGARMASFITTIFAPINEPTTATTTTTAAAATQSQRKITNTIANATSHMTTTNSSNSSTTTVTQQQQQQQQQSTTGSSSTTSKVYIKKTGSSSNSSSSTSGRKESFGSRDSLNDILSETGLPSGNVAAQRKSLENKNLDLSKQPGSQAKGNSTITTITASSSSSNSNSTTTAAASSYTELRKSLDNMDEKLKSPPPPVLSKKPSVPLKKTPTGAVPVGGNLMGANIKKKNPEGKLTSAVSHDLADGLAGSKMASGQLPDGGAPGSLVMRRAATIAVEDTDFDRVERTSILTDMRAGRVKAPKRRPPSAAINVLNESNNNSVYVSMNGASELSEDGGIGDGKRRATSTATASSDENSTGEEQLAKPKPREWQQKKAPWMEELKASQVTRKKPTPNTEPRGASVAERTSKLFATEQATSSVVTTTASSSTTNSSSNSSSTATTTTKVQSSAVTSSNLMQQSMFVDSSNKKELTASVVTTSTNSTSSSSNTTTSNSNDAFMSKSMTAAKAAIAPASSDEEPRAPRPNSLSIRNRSVSPLVKSANASSSTAEEKINTLNASSAPEAAAVPPATAAPQLNNHHHEESSAPRVQQLEQRVDKLEAIVQIQQRTIEDLIRTLREETERVQLLRGELDKYAQCVTQV